MPWTNPDLHVWADGETVTASAFNTYIQQNLVQLADSEAIWFASPNPPAIPSVPGVYRKQHFHVSPTTDINGNSNIVFPAAFANGCTVIVPTIYFSGGPRDWLVCYGNPTNWFCGFTLVNTQAAAPQTSTFVTINVVCYGW